MSSSVGTRIRHLIDPPVMPLPPGVLKNFDPTEMAPRRARPVKVLFVVSAGRCGSTLLDRLIGQCDNVAAIGELYAIWEVGLGLNYDCGCGLPFRECPMWANVLNDALGGSDAIDPSAMEQYWRRNDRMAGAHLRRLLSPSGRRSLRNAGDAARILDALCAAVADETGAELVVDTSKSIFHALYALGGSTIDPYVLHLVRDPRAVVYSWTRPAREIDFGVAMPTKTLLGTTAWYIAINEAAAAFGRDEPRRYRRLRYEDFISRPADAIESIGDLCGVDLESDWLRRGGLLELKRTHAGCGNKVRFATQLEIRADERWRSQMKAWRRFVVGAAVLPWSRRFGYGLF
jgi:Sulfotransferase family